MAMPSFSKLLIREARRLLNLEPEGEDFPYVTVRGLLLFLVTGGLIMLTLQRERGLGITAYIRGPGRGRPTYGKRAPTYQRYMNSAHARMRLRQRISRLQRHGILELSQDKKTTRIRLTPKGREHIERYILKNLNTILPKPSAWDGVWRMLLFDIPEQKRFARDALRQTLERIGFYRLQKSAFVYPYPCQKELEAIVDYFAVRPFVSIIDTKHLGWQDDAARKLFKL